MWGPTLIALLKYLSLVGKDHWKEKNIVMLKFNGKSFFLYFSNYPWFPFYSSKLKCNQHISLKFSNFHIYIYIYA